VDEGDADDPDSDRHSKSGKSRIYWTSPSVPNKVTEADHDEAK
jgi:hypothetical protein